MSRIGSTATPTGIGLVALFTLVLVIFKVRDVIDWSWWAVAAPLWITAGVVVLVQLACAGIALAKWSRGRH